MVEMFENRENELNNIFKEKLYISKKDPLKDLTNIKTKTLASKPVLEGLENVCNLDTIEYSQDPKNFSVQTKIKTIDTAPTFNDNEESYVFKQHSLGENTKRIDYCNQSVYKKEQCLEEPNNLLDSVNLPKQTVLEGIYDDVELKDVLKTKELLEYEKRVSFSENTNVKESSGLLLDTTKKKLTLVDYEKDSSKVACRRDASDYNVPNRIIEEESVAKENKIKQLEQEFNSMIQTQKEALKMKSKIYQFVYSEIKAMKTEFTSKIEKLERENLVLSNKVILLNKNISDMHSSVTTYNQSMVNKVNVWKRAVEKQVKAYLIKIQQNSITKP